MHAEKEIQLFTGISEDFQGDHLQVVTPGVHFENHTAGSNSVVQFVRIPTPFFGW